MGPFRYVAVPVLVKPSLYEPVKFVLVAAVYEVIDLLLEKADDLVLRLLPSVEVVEARYLLVELRLDLRQELVVRE